MPFKLDVVEKIHNAVKPHGTRPVNHPTGGSYLIHTSRCLDDRLPY